MMKTRIQVFLKKDNNLVLTLEFYNREISRKVLKKLDKDKKYLYYKVIDDES